MTEQDILTTISTDNKKKFLINPILFINTLVVILILLVLYLHIPTPKWEYKTLKISANKVENPPTIKGTHIYSEINLSETDLNELGKQGWELVSSSIEMETFYKTEDESYIMSSQHYIKTINEPYVRPQALICIFKRSL
jgi:hypothetical protein